MDPQIGSVISQFDPRIAALLGWVVVVTKTSIDWLKTFKELPVWAPPALACVGAMLVLVLLMSALGIPLTEQLLAQAALSSLIATILAIGQTALQARTKPGAPQPIEGVLVEGPAIPTVGEVADELERRMKQEQADPETPPAPVRRRPRPVLEDEAP